MGQTKELARGFRFQRRKTRPLVIAAVKDNVRVETAVPDVNRSELPI
jgi:hypothetical protein